MPLPELTSWSEITAGLNDDQLSELVRIVHMLRSDIDVFGSGFMQSPRARWFKRYADGRFVMWIVNRAYTSYTGITLPAYFGREDGLLWDAETTEEFHEKDLECVRSRVRVATEETATNPTTGEHQVWVGSKVPAFNAAGDVLGVFGEADPWPVELWDRVPEDIKRVVRLS